MEHIATSFMKKGDTESAAKIFEQLKVTRPRFGDMERYCRVLSDPMKVPLPHRHADIAEAILEPKIPIESLFGVHASPDATLKAFNRLLLLLHPDKNPHPKAASAFVRLQELKTKALDAVEERRLQGEAKLAEDQRYMKIRSTPPPQVPTKDVEPLVAPKVSLLRTLRTQYRRSGEASDPSSRVCDSPRKEFNGVLSSLQQHKKVVKLSCDLSLTSFESSSGQPRDRAPSSQDDETEEVLNCTVTSSWSSLEGSTRSATSTFTLKDKTASMDSFHRRLSDEDITRDVVRSGVSTFATQAKALSSTMLKQFKDGLKRVSESERQSHVL